MYDGSRLAAARTALERRGEVADGLLSGEIGASWARCLDAGLDPNDLPRNDLTDPALWREVRERHERVRLLARSEMEALHGQIAGSNSLIAFAAADGTVLDAISDDSFRRPAHDRALQPGVNWRELARGTNAMGLAVALRRPAVVHGAEHFFRGDVGLACVAEPVWNFDGSLAGVLDASTSIGTRQLHTRALMRMAATQVGNALFRDGFREGNRDGFLLAIHAREEFLFTSGAGLLSISGDGRVQAVSAQARVMLHGLPLDGECRFAELFADRFGETVARRTAGEAFRLRDRSGSAFLAAVVMRARDVRPSRDAAPVAAPAMGVPIAPGPSGPGQRAYVSEDAAVGRAVTLAAAAARRGLPILVRGPTGTGKEQLARGAHAASGRGGAFVAVNCAALPPDLVEAELFGHVEGAFTGARRGGAPGLVVEADRGTLFLDEIGDMPLRAQAALLRLLDDWTVRPVGGGPARTVDVLLVSATNVALDVAVADHRFRADLLYRLAVVPVDLPPLSARTDFAAVARAVLRRTDPDCHLTEDAIVALRARRWDGNIRELRNVLLRATLLAPGVLDAAALTPHLPAQLAAAADLPPAEPAAIAVRDGDGSLDTRMSRAILETRARCNGSVSETARRLGISRNRVYRVLRHETDPELPSCPR